MRLLRVVSEAGLEGARRFEWERVLLRCELPTMTKAIGLALATFANKDGTNAHPGNERLRVSLGVKSQRTIERHLDALRCLGLIERTFTGSSAGRRKLADCYRLTVPNDLLDRVGLTDDPATRSPDSGDVWKTNDHPASVSGDSAEHPTPVTRSPDTRDGTPDTRDAITRLGSRTTKEEHHGWLPRITTNLSQLCELDYMAVATR